MKKRIICGCLALLISFFTACTEAEIYENIQDLSSDKSGIVSVAEKEYNTAITEDENNTDLSDEIKNDVSVDDVLIETDIDAVFDDVDAKPDAVEEIADNELKEEAKNTEITPDVLNSENDIEKTLDNVSETEYSINELSGEYIVIKSAVVRSGPSTDFEKIGQLNENDIVEVTGYTEDGWYQFVYELGEGFANQKFFEDLETFEQVKEETTDDLNNLLLVVDSAFMQSVADLCNEERAANGLEMLTYDETLTSYALIRADEIGESFSHTRPDGSDFYTVIGDFPATICGENIAAGQDSPKTVVDSWMNSPSHRDNILNPNYTKIGVGLSHNGEYGMYWVQLFTD